MVRMFKALEDTGLRGFLEGTTLVFESAVTEFFSNARVIAGTIVSTVSGKKLVVTEEMFSRTFKLPTEGMQNLSGIPNETIAEMRTRFSATTVPFKSSGKKKDLLFEYRLLHDIVAKSLCAKAGSFDKVTCEKFELMVAISAGLSVNWSRILFQRLLGMVQNPRKQSHGYIVQISTLLELLLQADLGTSTKLHAKKVLTSKQIENYIKINQGTTPTEDSASNTEGEPSQHTQQVPPEITKSLADATEQNVPKKRKHKGGFGHRLMFVNATPTLNTQVSESSGSLPLTHLLKRMWTQRQAGTTQPDPIPALTIAPEEFPEDQIPQKGGVDNLYKDLALNDQTEHDEHHDHNFTTANVDRFHQIAPTEGEGTVAVDDLKESGDAKKGKGGSSCRPREGPSGRGLTGGRGGSSSQRGRSDDPGDPSNNYRYTKWF
ncbi:hypothetical protein F511_25653 [Dorcoceras hygrometricum]|uniref:Dystroglycan-like n=1 Tax=Dorcoceras hygrometricum TaxID=472368 RepID=A0A2Z7B562_9LAMI|nr:hypothetical protein F511_25653 [Dorcoceras hygrometricum]